MTKIEFIPQPFDNDYFKYHAEQAISNYERSRTSKARSKMLTVIAGLCRHAYLKGRNDEKMGVE